MRIKHRIIQILALSCTILLSSCPGIPDPVDEADPNSDSLLFKLVNQWGVGGWGENVPDGALWITAEALKAQRAVVYFFEPRINYAPTALVSFSLRHADRTDLTINAYLGDPRYAPTKPSKLFLPTSANSTSAPLNGEILAMDVSEWREGLETKDLYFYILDSTGNSSAAELLSLNLEIYADFGKPASQILTASTTLPFTISNGLSGLVKIDSAGNISPLGQASDKGNAKSATSVSMLDIASLSRRKLNDEEFFALQEQRGIREEGRRYNKVIGGFGTGLAPPDLSQWQEIRAEGMTIELAEGAKGIKALPDSIDLMEEAAFPPIANQGSLGSCAAFSTAYYMLGYLLAKEKGWDLSSLRWDGDDPGNPSGMLDSIMSPKFVFNLINKGEGGGSTFEDAVRLITEFGCSTWGNAPYDETDYISWPSETAWREAPRYRAQKPDYGDYGTLYYMTISTEDHIEILKRILAAGIPLTIGIDADNYKKLDEQDIWHASTYIVAAINHANTIVGYKAP